MECTFQHPFGHLFVVHPDGTGLRQIPLDTGPGRSFPFEPGRPDGERIVFSMYWKENGYQEDIFTVRARRERPHAGHELAGHRGVRGLGAAPAGTVAVGSQPSDPQGVAVAARHRAVHVP